MTPSTNAPDIVQVGRVRVDAREVVLQADGELFAKAGVLLEGGPPLSRLVCAEDGAPLVLAALSSQGKLVPGRLWSGAPVSLVCAPADSSGRRWLFVLSVQDLLIERTAAAQVRLRTIVGSVIAGFAHEVRNPLAAIVTLVELCISAPGMPLESLEHLAKIQRLVYRVEDLIRLALQYGRPNQPKFGWHQLGRLVEGSIDNVLLVSPEAVRPVAQLPAQPVPVYLDASHAVSILTNLLNNALHATTDKQPVSVVLRTAEEPDGPPMGFVAVDIRDAGPGVREELRERIFEPFFTTKAKGTGLGLAIARDLARMNGGDVVLLRSSSQGSTFRFLLRVGSGQ